MQLLSGATVCWPGIDADIMNYVRTCTLCTKQNASQPEQLMLPHNIHTLPLTILPIKGRNIYPCATPLVSTHLYKASL